VRTTLRFPTKFSVKFLHQVYINHASCPGNVAAVCVDRELNFPLYVHQLRRTHANIALLAHEWGWVASPETTGGTAQINITRCVLVAHH
jgi:hypothetical protein